MFTRHVSEAVVVRVQDMGHEDSDGVKHGKDRSEGDQVEVWGFLKEIQPSTELRMCLGVEAIGDVTRKADWGGMNMWKKCDADCVKAYARLVVEGTTPVGRPKNTWHNTASTDMSRPVQGIYHLGVHEMENGRPCDGVRRPQQRYEYLIPKYKRNCISRICYICEQNA